jgi:hypothetical protein
MALVKHYYRVTGIKFNSQQSLIDSVIATPTSFDQSLFFPQETFPRLEVITKIRSGDEFFINQETKRVSIQVFLVDGKTYLKTSNKPLQKDFIEFEQEKART